jgi:putative glutamine amidotransferase
MHKPIIGIAVSHYPAGSWSPPVVGHRLAYIESVLQAGGVPLLLPPVTAEYHDVLDAYYAQLDGLMIPGGGDIDPSLYGAERHPKTDNIIEARDYSELYLVRKAVADGMPVLGICRGIQVINVALGGTLIQDIPDATGAEGHNESAQREDWLHMAHAMHLESDSQLAHMLGTTTIAVNSLHHQALDRIGTGLRVVAQSDDGIVEAIESADHNFIVAVQCHPETLQGNADPRWQGMFQAFVTRASAYAVVQ